MTAQAPRGDFRAAVSAGKYTVLELYVFRAIAFFVPAAIRNFQEGS